MELADAYTMRVESLRDLIEVYDREVAMLERKIHELLRDDRGYQAIQALDGVGRTIAAIFVAEIGDVTRFRSRRSVVFVGRAHAPPSRVRHQSACAARSPNKDRSWCAGRRSKPIVRYHGGPALTSHFHRIAERRGKNKARVAIARKLLTLVFYGLRDGEIRCLATASRRVRARTRPQASSESA